MFILVQGGTNVSLFELAYSITFEIIYEVGVSHILLLMHTRTGVEKVNDL